MSRDAFRTVVKGLITHQDQVLIGQKEESEGHPISGEWHFLGGHLESGENVEAGIKREVREETGLPVTVEALIDVMTFTWASGGDKNCLQILYHCEADSTDATARDDLQAVQWVSPSELTNFLHEGDANRLTTRPRQQAFLNTLVMKENHDS